MNKLYVGWNSRTNKILFNPIIASAHSDEKILWNLCKLFLGVGSQHPLKTAFALTEGTRWPYVIECYTTMDKMMHHWNIKQRLFPQILYMCGTAYLGVKMLKKNLHNVNSPKLDRNARVKADLQPLILPDRNVNCHSMPFFVLFTYHKYLLCCSCYSVCTCRGASLSCTWLTPSEGFLLLLSH